MKYYGQRMDIDKTTLTDLEVFEARDGTRGLFDLIDRTSTRQGSHALRRRIEHPSSDIDTIRGTQEAVAFLQAHPGLVDFDEALIEGVAQYLRSKIVGVETAAGIREHSEHAWMRLRYRDLLKEIANGVATTKALFGRVAQRCERLAQSAPPAAVAQIVGRLAGVADVVLSVDARSRTVLGADRALRSVHRSEIEDALTFIGELDALNAMAIATSALGWIMPEFGRVGVLHAGGRRGPSPVHRKAGRKSGVPHRR
jgi:hypothetical protein